MPTYIIGLDQSISILSWLVAACILLGIFVIIRSMLTYERPKLLMIGVMSLVILPSAVALCLFPAVYSTINLASQNVFDTSFWSAEIASGVLALRVTTYMLTFQLLKWATKFATGRSELIRTQYKEGLSPDDAANFMLPKKPEVTKLWLRSDLALFAFLQFVFYLVSVCALWVCAIYGVHSLLSALASWAVFFIVDDAVVIAEYSEHFQSSPLFLHNVKVMGFNVLLLAVISTTLFTSGSGQLAAALSITMAALAIAAGAIAIRTKEFEVKKNA